MATCCCARSRRGRRRARIGCSNDGAAGSASRSLLGGGMVNSPRASLGYWLLCGIGLNHRDFLFRPTFSLPSALHLAKRGPSTPARDESCHAPLPSEGLSYGVVGDPTPSSSGGAWFWQRDRICPVSAMQSSMGFRVRRMAVL